MFPQNFLWLVMETGTGCTAMGFSWQDMNEKSRHLNGRKPLFCMTQTNQINSERFAIALDIFKCNSGSFDRIIPAASSIVLTCLSVMAFPIPAHILWGCGIKYLPKVKLIKLGHFQKATTRNVLTALVIAGNHNMEDLNWDLGKGYLAFTWDNVS